MQSGSIWSDLKTWDCHKYSSAEMNIAAVLWCWKVTNVPKQICPNEWLVGWVKIRTPIQDNYFLVDFLCGIRNNIESSHIEPYFAADTLYKIQLLTNQKAPSQELAFHWSKVGFYKGCPQQNKALYIWELSVLILIPNQKSTRKYLSWMGVRIFTHPNDESIEPVFYST